MVTVIMIITVPRRGQWHNYTMVEGLCVVLSGLSLQLLNLSPKAFDSAAPLSQVAAQTLLLNR